MYGYMGRSSVIGCWVYRVLAVLCYGLCYSYVVGCVFVCSSLSISVYGRGISELSGDG